MDLNQVSGPKVIPFTFSAFDPEQPKKTGEQINYLLSHNNSLAILTCEEQIIAQSDYDEYVTKHPDPDIAEQKSSEEIREASSSKRTIPPGEPRGRPTSGPSSTMSPFTPRSQSQAEQETAERRQRDLKPLDKAFANKPRITATHLQITSSHALASLKLTLSRSGIFIQNGTVESMAQRTFRMTLWSMILTAKIPDGLLDQVVIGDIRGLWLLLFQQGAKSEGATLMQQQTELNQLRKTSEKSYPVIIKEFLKLKLTMEASGAAQYPEIFWTTAITTIFAHDDRYRHAIKDILKSAKELSLSEVLDWLKGEAAVMQDNSYISTKTLALTATTDDKKIKLQAPCRNYAWNLDNPAGPNRPCTQNPCRYSHSTKPTSTPKTKANCHFYDKNKSCKYGDKCKYAHVDQALNTSEFFGYADSSECHESLMITTFESDPTGNPIANVSDDRFSLHFPQVLMPTSTSTTQLPLNIATQDRANPGLAPANVSSVISKLALSARETNSLPAERTHENSLLAEPVPATLLSPEAEPLTATMLLATTTKLASGKCEVDSDSCEVASDACKTLLPSQNLTSERCQFPPSCTFLPTVPQDGWCPESDLDPPILYPNSHTETPLIARNNLAQETRQRQSGPQYSSDIASDGPLLRSLATKLGELPRDLHELILQFDPTFRCDFDVAHHRRNYNSSDCHRCLEMRRKQVLQYGPAQPTEMFHFNRVEATWLVRLTNDAYHRLYWDALSQLRVRQTTTFLQLQHLHGHDPTLLKQACIDSGVTLRSSRSRGHDRMTRSGCNWHIHVPNLYWTKHQTKTQGTNQRHYDTTEHALSTQQRKQLHQLCDTRSHRNCSIKRNRKLPSHLRALLKLQRQRRHYQHSLRGGADTTTMVDCYVAATDTVEHVLLAHSTETDGVMDTGASSHCAPNDGSYTDAIIPGSLTDCSVLVQTASQQPPLTASKRCDMAIVSDQLRPITLSRVLLVDNFRRMLVSVSTLAKDGYSTTFSHNQCKIQQDDVACLTLTKTDHGALYTVPRSRFMKQIHDTANLASTYADQTQLQQLWHRRLGHCESSQMQSFYKNEGIKGEHSHDGCPDCTQAKQHHAKYPKHTNYRAEYPGQSFAVDFAGPYRTASPFGQRYLCLFVDVRSRFMAANPARLKSELTQLVENHIALCERTQQPRKVVYIVSDGALSDTTYLKSLKERGITVRVVAPGSSRLNGLVERRIRSVTESARAMCLTAGLPPCMFLPACEYAVQVQNHLPLHTTTLAKLGPIGTLPEITQTPARNPCPAEIWYRRLFGTWAELFSRFRVFGCLAFALHRSPNKQVTKSERAIFLGLAPNNPNACLLMSLETKQFLRYFVTRDVVTHENTFPFKRTLSLPAVPSDPHLSSGIGELDDSDLPTKLLNSGAPCPVTVTTVDPFEAMNDAPSDSTPNLLESDEIDHGVTSPLENTSAPIEPAINAAPAENLQDQKINKQLSFSFEAEKVTTPRASNAKIVLETMTPPEPAPSQMADTTNPPAPTSEAESETDLLRGPTPTSKFVIGKIYSSIKDTHGWAKGKKYNEEWGKVVVHQDHMDGDVEVTFPNHPDVPHDKLFTIPETDIDVALTITDQDPTTAFGLITFSPFDSRTAESVDGQFFTHEEFTCELLSSEQAFSATSIRPPATWTPQQRKSELGVRINKDIKLSDLVGKVPADSIKVPRTHYELKDCAVRELIEEAQNTELQTIIDKDVLHDAHSALPGDLIIPTMFVNRAKSDANGMLAKFKARLTTRGDLDKPAPGCSRRTYAAVLLPTTMWLLLSLHCADLSVNFHQLDLEAAFVTALATRRIVIRLPHGYFGPGKRVANAVHVLRYNLYGSDDAPIVYQTDLIQKHKRLGFNTIREDHCYFELRRGAEFIKMVFHVDDFLIAQRGESLWSWYTMELKKIYNYTAAPLHFYLGMRFARDSVTGMFSVDQEAQIDKMARAFDLSLEINVNIKTPISSFSEDDRPKLADLPVTLKEKREALKIPYRQAVGHLTYLAQCTHFEISLPTRIAAAFVGEWGPKHWQWVKQIMRYLLSKSSKFMFIHGGTDHRTLEAWTDSDHAGNPDNRRSMAANLTYYGRDLIDWYARNETIVAHSSAESELMALDACARSVQSLRWLLSALGRTISTPSIIHMDSQSAMGMAENPIQNRRNRHIHARYFYVRELIANETIQLHKIPTADNLADILATYKDACTFLRLIHLCKPQLHIKD